jgi:hypothetical protein
MKKKVHKINAMETRNDELIDLIKKYIFLEFNDEAMIDAVLTESGDLITREQLKKWKHIAKTEKKDAKVEIDLYLENMLKIGMFEDVKRQYELAKSMLTTNSQSFFKVVRDGDVNKQMALTNVIIRQMEDMRKIVTSMGYLAKTKEILERGFAGGGALEDQSGTSITIETKPGSSFDEAVAQSIGEIEMKDNEVF